MNSLDKQLQMAIFDNYLDDRRNMNKPSFTHEIKVSVSFPGNQLINPISQSATRYKPDSKGRVNLAVAFWHEAFD